MANTYNDSFEAFNDFMSKFYKEMQGQGIKKHVQTQAVSLRDKIMQERDIEHIEQEQQRKAKKEEEYINRAKSACDEAEALSWYEQAAQLGSEEAQQAIEHIRQKQKEQKQTIRSFYSILP